MDEDVAALIRRVRPVPLRTLLPAGGMLAGRHRARLTGQGIEFAGIRAYVPGDDVRTIDWRVTARRSEPYVREYAEDRETTTYVAVDCSASAGFGGTGGKESEAIEAAAALILGAESCGDRAGLCLFSDRVEGFVPARRGRRHTAVLLSSLLKRRPFSRGTDIPAMIRFLASAVRPRCTIAVVSDFVSPSFSEDLAILRRRHEVVLLRVADPFERNLPDLGLLSLEDAESGEQVVVDTSDPVFRERYRAAAALAEQDLANRAGGCGTPLVTLQAGAGLADLLPGLTGRRR